jgi:anti-anti-sigma factor
VEYDHGCRSRRLTGEVTKARAALQNAALCEPSVRSIQRGTGLAEMNVTDFPGSGGFAPPDLFRMEVSERRGGKLMVLHGELDLAAVDQLEATLASETGRLVVDLRHLRFVDASGLAVLLRADARSRQDGLNLSFIAGQAVRRLFECAHLPDPLNYVDLPDT